MTNPPHTTRRVGQEGMTLVELMIAMLLTGVIVTMMMGAYMVAQRSDRQNAEDAQALANLRLVTDRIGADLREARRVYADSSGTRLHFWADTDRDNQQDMGERITFELLTLSGSAPTTAGVAAKLVRRTDVTGSETLVSEGMKAFAGRNVFLYSPTFTPVAAPSAVWTETTLVSLVMAADEADKPYPGPRTLKTDLRLRNARTY